MPGSVIGQSKDYCAGRQVEGRARENRWCARGKTDGAMCRWREDRWSRVTSAGKQTGVARQTHIEMESAGRKVRDVVREK